MVRAGSSATETRWKPGGGSPTGTRAKSHSWQSSGPKHKKETKGTINLEQDLELLIMCLDNSQEMGAILCSLFSLLAQRYRQIKNVIFVDEIN